MTQTAFCPRHVVGDSGKLHLTIDHFRRLGWPIAVLATHDPDQPFSDYPAMAAMCDRLEVYRPTAADVALRASGRMDDWCPPALLERVRRLADAFQPDVVIAQYVFSSRCLEAADPERRRVRVLDADNVFAGRAQLYRAAGIPYDWFSTDVEQERMGLNRADLLMAVQEREAEHFRREAPGRPVLVFPFVMPARRHPHPTGSDLLFVGAWNRVNAEGVRRFAEEALPRIRERHPQAELTLIGRVCEQVPPLPGVRACGLVPNTDEAYARAAIVINPVSIGTGMKTKTVEALCHGKCLVSTPAGLQGLEERSGLFHLGRNMGELADHVCRLLSDREELARTGEAAFRFAVEYFNPDLVLSRYRRALLEATAHRRREARS
jgi:glycosyltransferase involved in cell wall biosynthesis